MHNPQGEGRDRVEHGDVDDEHVNVQSGEAKLVEELIEGGIEVVIHLGDGIFMGQGIIMIIDYILRAISLLVDA